MPSRSDLGCRIKCGLQCDLPRAAGVQALKSIHFKEEWAGGTTQIGAPRVGASPRLGELSEIVGGTMADLPAAHVEWVRAAAAFLFFPPILPVFGRLHWYCFRSPLPAPCVLWFLVMFGFSPAVSAISGCRHLLYSILSGHFGHFRMAAFVFPPPTLAICRGPPGRWSDGGSCGVRHTGL